MDGSEKVMPKNTMDGHEKMVPTQPRHHSYTICGVPVRFPVKPYPSQLAMMDKIIQAMKRRQNGLLESPTGSGKSLAILCSTLAWQQQQIARAKRYNGLIDAGVTDLDMLAEAADLPSLVPRSTPGAPPEPEPPTSSPTAHPLASSAGFFYDDDGDDFRTQPPAANMFQADGAEQVDLAFQFRDYILADKPKKIKVPKIFIGTRTHKQVAQIVKELRRTYYNKVKMVVLSSREHTCIHPIVSSSSNKNEQCRELLNPLEHEKSCRYYDGRIRNHDYLAEKGGLEGAWDIEDLVKVGCKLRACPYFTARELLSTAELVICPYNYLVDPIIKKSMKISLKNHVVVLDEAHNIEDSARDAASCTVSQDQMMEAYNDLKNQNRNVEDCHELADMLSALSSWIDDNKDSLMDYIDYDRSGKIFTGIQLVAVLDHLHLGQQRCKKLQEHFTKLLEDQPKESNPLVLSATTKSVLEGFLLIFHFLFEKNMKYADDYRVAVVKEQVRKKSRQKLDGWVSRKTVLDLEYSISFWCLNPAVVFDPISTETHSIILTSGTLSPMTSFQSELGVSFNIRFEANHVIDKNQTFIGTIGYGPRSTALLATYKNTDTWEFQDQIGELVLKVCQTVPGGILCFLPSYSLLDKLHDRWHATGLWNEITKIKEAMTEKRKVEEFERDMLNFYATIKNRKTEGVDSITGAFFLAVYRGKVSEGLDLTDDNARAVIAVGIPFPNVKDIQIDLKKKYNNIYQGSRKLLSGQEWYEIQAYRALNQALGRCIRHRYDWGALLLVDVRFHRGQAGQQENKHIQGLSKWVRNNITWHPNFLEATNSLTEFVKNMMTNPPQPPSTHGEILAATALEPSYNAKVQTPLSVKNETLCHEVIDNPQADCEAPTMLFQNVKENISHDQRGCRASENIKNIHNHHEKSDQRCGSGNCKTSEGSKKVPTESKKRLLNAMDYQDWEDFNLALSPAAPSAYQPPSLMMKRERKKKGTIFIDAD